MHAEDRRQTTPCIFLGFLFRGFPCRLCFFCQCLGLIGIESRAALCRIAILFDSKTRRKSPTFLGTLLVGFVGRLGQRGVMGKHTAVVGQR